jgi:CobQ/CobB/MinD/ParA nucleotide binding domain
MRRNVTEFDRQDIEALNAVGSGGGTAAPTIHLTLQGKGGVGKSLVSSILAQYFRHRGAEIHCVDTDPVNQTFSQYAELAAEHLKLMHDGKIDSRGFDILMERLITEDGIFIVDNGASTFIPLWSYIVENNVLELLRATGRRLCVHTVVTGGQALGDTLKGFKSLADSTADRNIVVWLNEYFGLIERDGKTFTEMLAYKESESKIFGLVRIPKRNQDTFGRDIEEVISRKLTFEDAIRNGRASVMSKQRLKVVQRDLFEQLDQMPLL